MKLISFCLFSHDEFFNYEDFSKPIQHKRINYEFVAECFDENNIPLYDGRMTLKRALN